MRNARSALLLSLGLLSTFVLGGCASTAALNTDSSVAAAARTCPPAGSSTRAVDEKRFIEVGGIEQWITMKGDDCSNPVVLFVHGGPGNPLSPFADAIYAGWEKEFTLVQWDQRGAGRTYARRPPSQDDVLTVRQLRDDGIAVTEFVASQFGRRKIIITGGSWGSVLAVHMMQARPDLFAGYVGVGQLVNKIDNQAASYARVMELARRAGDDATVTTLEALGAPPWKNPRSHGVLRRATRVYEAKSSTAAPRGWWVPAPEYATETFEAEYEAGEDYSFLQFVGMNDDGMLSTVDLPRLGLRFDVPIHFVHGAEDLVTVKEVAQRYFERIEAPAKSFVVVPAAGHDPNEALVNAQLESLRLVRAWWTAK